MSEQIAVPKLLADKTNIAILLLLRTQPLHCRKLSAILEKGEPQIARRLSQLERAGIIRSEWVHKGRNIKVYFLKADRIQIQITNEGIGVTYKPEKREKFYALESIFRFDIPVPEQFVDRETQLKSLSESSFFVLTGIAGIGKTTLASFYAHNLKNAGKKIFWHTFSELDSLLFLVKKLAIFLSKYDCPHLLDYLKADGSDMRVVEALLKDHMNSPDFAFFFDDYHLVTDESMDHLFSRLKKISEGQICVISRYKPPFITAFDTILEVRLEEMEPEAIQELLESRGVHVRGEILEKVSQKIGGHPLALELLCQAAAALDPAALMEEIPSFEIESYLWDEIYSRLDPEEQQLLISLSIFRKPVNIEAVESMCPFPHVRTVIRQLIKKNLLKRVDGGYVHHAITRIFCSKLVQTPEDLHRKAAAFYVQAGSPTDIMEALYHFLEAKAHQEGADTILTHAELLINEGYAQSLLTFCKTLDNLPDYRYPLLGVEGDIYLLQGEYDAATACFRIPLKKASGPAKALLHRKLGEVYERKREYKTAETLFLQGLDILEEQDVVEQGTILVRLAAVYRALNEPDRALSCCEKALTFFSQSEYKKGIAQVYNQMGEIFRFTNTEKALELLFSSLKISQAIGDVQTAASTLVTVGSVLYERGQSDEAVTYYEESLKISEQIGDMVGIARCCNNIGVKYALEWKWPHAMEYFHQTLSICSKIKDKKGIAFSYSNLGRAYSHLGSFEKALEYFFASLELREELSDTREIAYLYYNIGLTFQEMGNFEKALQWIEKSLQLREFIEYTLGVAYCCVSMGELYGEMGELDAAQNWFQRVLNMYREENDWIVATVNVYSAKVHVYKKEYEKALELTEGAVDALEAVGSIGAVTEAHLVVAEAHLGLGHINQALEHADLSLQYAVKMGSLKYEGKARRILGTILCDAGEYKRAEDELRLSVRLLKKYIHERAKTYVQFATLCKKKGSPEEKYTFLLQKAARIFEDVGIKGSTHVGQ